MEILISVEAGIIVGLIIWAIILSGEVNNALKKLKEVDEWSGKIEDRIIRNNHAMHSDMYELASALGYVKVFNGNEYQKKAKNGKK